MNDTEYLLLISVECAAISSLNPYLQYVMFTYVISHILSMVVPYPGNFVSSFG